MSSRHAALGILLMNVLRAKGTTPIENIDVVLPMGQVVLLLLLLDVGSVLILTKITQAAFNSIFLLIIVSIGGLALCRVTQVRLKDPSLKILGYFWLIKLGLTFLLLYVGWMPELDQSTSNAWGYDPQRYYIQGKELIDNNWSLDFVSLNYVGILYYYGAIYYVFGHNPVIPSLINAFVTLIATLYVVKVGYEIKGQRSSHDWILAFALVLPELLWFDVLTSREMLTAALLLFAMLTIGRYFARTAPISLPRTVAICGLAVLVIAAVRTSMLLPVMVSITLMALLARPQRGSPGIERTILAVVAAAALFLLPVIAGYLGGYDFEMGKALQATVSGEENIALGPDAEWSENSIGMLLIPEGLLQSLLFLLPRMVLYLVSPLPNVFLPVSALLEGTWEAWQKLFILLSSVINVLAIPYALASFIQAMKTRNVNSASLVFHIPCWVTFIAIAGGNLIIHERYRVMASLLLWGCVWLGARTCSRNLIIRTSLFWYGLLTLGAVFYVTYKLSLA